MLSDKQPAPHWRIPPFPWPTEVSFYPYQERRVELKKETWRAHEARREEILKTFFETTVARLTPFDWQKLRVIGGLN